MIALDLTPTEEAQTLTVARRTGLAPAEYVKKLVKEHLPPDETTPAPAVDEEAAAAIALMEAWIAAAPTGPKEIRAAEADRNEFMRNLNRNRAESGERSLFP